jgi:hypothetical protein
MKKYIELPFLPLLRVVNARGGGSEVSLIIKSDMKYILY